MKFRFCLIIVCCFVHLSTAKASNPLEILKTISSSSLLVVDKNNEPKYSKDIDKLLIPASTVKILTALIALEQWGKAYRFTTDYYFNPHTNHLWVKGFGDPFLISEELDIVVKKLKQVGITELDGIGIDNSYFSKTIKINGQGDSLNPYDASLSALAANFNTIKVRIFSDSISSSELQTPLTPLAEQLARGLEIGTHRINLGKVEHGTRYFAELLKSKLNRTGIPTDAVYMSGAVPDDSEFLLKYENSHPLENIIASMLEYSNNFIANQLFLVLGAKRYGGPATVEKSQDVYSEYIKKNFNWSKYTLLEGAGLSRANQLSAKQLIDILERFKSYKHLMPSQNLHIYAKSGTLKNVSTYAGYLNYKNEWHAFALMINQKVPYDFREQIATELLGKRL